MFGSMPPGMYHPGFAAPRVPPGDVAARTDMAGTKVQVLPEHRAALDRINKNRVGCLKDYRRRIARFIEFIEKHSKLVQFLS